MFPFQTLRRAIKERLQSKGFNGRVGEGFVKEVDKALEGHLNRIVDESYAFAQHSNRTTLKTKDAKLVLRLMGVTQGEE